ncbi:ABC transporter permease [Alkalicella caledoniensis]|uniref:ABC transporter permease n=1 Tax=Alkalicella caledoniensis TaxID=2731377 RepID=A0A7G9WB08_ALKCA|nr:ABC transporter permease [Alkalicella caledoniensis]QNO15870.1 ABC transporter permease [Alkalicella caledoniensis]
MISVLKIIWGSCMIQMKQSFARATFKFCVLVQPIIYAVITYMMFRNSGIENFTSYVVLGTGIMSLWSSICFSSAGDIERERYMGTLQIVTSVPVQFKIIMLGKVLGNTILGLMSMVITFVFVSVVFGEVLTIANPLVFMASLIISLFSFMAISMLLAPSFTLSRNSRALMNCLEYPIFILCGVLFPIEVLPVWIRPLSYILSPTWAIKLLRDSSLGIHDFSNFATNIAIIILITVIYSIVASKLFDRIDKETRIKATLEVQ